MRDCQIDTDLEILLPDQYVNSIAERLALYRELDDLKTAGELGAFEKRMIDRFGPIPDQGVQLLQTIRLRWVSKAIGFEKLILKNERLACYFVSDPESDYYQGAVFSRVLNYVKSNPKKVTMRQRNDKLTLTFENTKTITQAFEKVSEIAPDLSQPFRHVPVLTTAQ